MKGPENLKFGCHYGSSQILVRSHNFIQFDLLRESIPKAKVYGTICQDLKGKTRARKNPILDQIKERNPDKFGLGIGSITLKNSRRILSRIVLEVPLCAHSQKFKGIYSN